MRQGQVTADSRAGVESGLADVVLARRLADRDEPPAGDPACEIVSCALLKPADSPRLDGESLDHIRVLAEAGVSWPPILVDRRTMRVVDGMHRLRAAQLRGESTVEVSFFDGDAQQAFMAAVAANIAHGLPLTLADRKDAARRIVGWQPERSDRWIGRVTGLAAGTVASVRRGLGAPDGQAAARLGQDGRVRPLNAAEGRLRAQRELAAHPDSSLREIARAAGVSASTAKSVRDRLGHGGGAALGTEHGAKSRSQPIGEQGIGRPQSLHGEPEQLRRAGSDLLLERLASDPSLRYSQSGRRLLQRLQIHANGASAVEELIDLVPSHCGFIIAKLARQSARRWLDLAEALERRLNPGA